MSTPPGGLDAAVVAEDLHKSFGDTKALCGVSFTIERAKVVGLLGPNGAGKTTAVRVLTTLIRPDVGRAFIDGIDVVAEPMRARARVGLTGSTRRSTSASRGPRTSSTSAGCTTCRSPRRRSGGASCSNGSTSRSPPTGS